MLQLYFFHKDLDPEIEPKIKVIKTLIYGVISSGNQAERGVRETANLQKEEYPRECEAINDDAYVDDMMSGENTKKEVDKVTDGLQVVLAKGGYELKPIVFSGCDPPADVSNGEDFINVAGMRWRSKLDLLFLNIDKLNFNPKHRGKKAPNFGELPERFTRKDCASRAAEVFDILGRFTPIIAGIKLDLRELCLRELDWNDFIPEDLIDTWKNNFDIISSLNDIQFRRCVVPEDALNLEIELLCFADASEQLACSAIYARFKRKNGLYSCQLLFARSKIIPKNTIIARGEVFGSVLNATTGHIVKLSLGDFVVGEIFFTDSQIVLHWISNSQLQLKQWVRNRIIEILRLTSKENWYYIESKFMLADLGTRKGVKLSDISEESRWVNGDEWTRQDRSTFPIKSVSDLKLTHDDLKAQVDESLKSDVVDNEWVNKQLAKVYSESYSVSQRNALDKITERYVFLNI